MAFIGKNMTVDALLKLLRELKKNGYGEQLIILASDAEGNNFKGVAEITAEHYNKDLEIEFGNPDLPENCLVFWPKD